MDEVKDSSYLTSSALSIGNALRKRNLGHVDELTVPLRNGFYFRIEHGCLDGKLSEF